MLSYLTDALGRVFEHPGLVTLFIIAGIFLLSGFVLQQVTDNVIAVSFMGVYATMAAALGLIGYGIVGLAKLFSRLQDHRAAHA